MGSGDSKPAPSSTRLKRAYESPEARDGLRVLVDRLWARGVSKEVAGLDAWMKDLGPSSELRTWFGHQSDRWDGFVEKYRHELDTPLRQMLLSELHGTARGPAVTLVYGARDEKENEAVVLREYLLRATPRPDAAWDVATKLLVTATVVAAAHHDAVAPASGLKLFSSSILTAQEVDSALEELLTHGQLHESSNGWKVTARGQQRMRQLSSM
ncbi:MAG: DUF488 domain-containing protein [Chloroflexota bacterium]|nr:MAG: hypothetical protein DLM70_03490 [Chloroflexota bacterium]